MQAIRTILSAVVAATLAVGVAYGAETRPKFKVTVTLSPKALAELTKKKEAVLVSAWYAGEPNAAGQKKAVEGEIDLGKEEVVREVTGATLDCGTLGAGYDPKLSKYVVAGSQSFNTNVISARRAVDDNLLSCEDFFGTFAEAAAKPIVIACRLIEE